jgi:hypothetical protein
VYYSKPLWRELSRMCGVDTDPDVSLPGTKQSYGTKHSDGSHVSRTFSLQRELLRMCAVDTEHHEFLAPCALAADGLI